MHKFLEKIKSSEQKPYVIKNFISLDEVKLFQKLYNELPVEINNRRQKIIKKKWSVDFDINLQKICHLPQVYLIGIVKIQIQVLKFIKNTYQVYQTMKQL